MLVVILLLFLFGVNFFTTHGRDLNNSTDFIASIAIYRNRAILALPRSNCTNMSATDISLTLLEVPWFGNDNLLLMTSRKSSSSSSSSSNLNIPQKWNDCKHVQSAVCVDIDPNKAMLWILDAGNAKCPPKIIIYSLLQNAIIKNYSLSSNKYRNHLKTLVLDPLSLAKAFIGLAQSKVLLIFTLKDSTLLTLDLSNTDKSTNNNNGLIGHDLSTEYLAVSRRDHALFMTGGRELGIFSLGLNDIQQRLGSASPNSSTIRRMNATYLGDKLGSSSGLIVDFKGDLNYYLVRDYAVVRWDVRNPSKAEYYNVLLQSYDALPFVSELFTDPFNVVWALVNPSNSSYDNCNHQIATNRSPNNIKRLVKLLKYFSYNNY